MGDFKPTTLQYAVPAQQQGSPVYLGVICLVAAIGGLLFGFDTAVISGTTGFFKAEFKLDAAMEGWVTSCALVGCMMGAALAGVLSDRFGRKKVLLLAAFFFAVSAVGCGLARTVTELVIARIVGGMGIGIASMLSPLYIAEISPPRLRGRLVSLQQFAIISGILGAYFSNALVLQMHLTDAQKWRWMFALGAFPAVIFFLLLLVVPESPRWLTKQGLVDRARQILARVAGSAQAEVEMADIQATIAHEGGSLGELLRPGIRLALLVGVALAIFQQITGINAILYYAPKIFKEAGAETTRAFSDTVWIGVVNLAFTILAIGVIDRLGRKLLLMLGSIGMGLSLVLVAMAFHYHVSGLPLLAVILAYVAAFAASMGPAVWVVMSEIFPTRIRGRAMSVATVCLWGACYAVSQTFPILLEQASKATPFWIYAAMCVLTVIFVAIFVPETKGKSLEQIEKELVG